MTKKKQQVTEVATEESEESFKKRIGFKNVTVKAAFPLTSYKSCKTDKGNGKKAVNHIFKGARRKL